MRTASIDIGTNTIRLLISERTGRGLLKIYINRVITRLGEGFSDNTRLLNSNAVNRSVAALYDFSKVIKKFHVNKIRAVATSVVRESKNGEEFVKQVADKTGLAVEVISGEEEAKLTVSGVLNSVSVNANNCIIFDIGGGSTEYVHIRSSNIVNLVSTNLGVVHLTEEFLRSEIETEQELANLSIYIKETLQRELENFEIIDKKDLILIGTAGTPTTLAAIELKLKEYNPELVNNFVLSEEMILSTIKKLLNIHKKDRAKITGLEKGREDILVVGALILIETLRKYSQNSVIVSDGGVLEGIAYSQN
ncbi:MAG: Ppx/GppA family phosphatase [Thermodesulfobacteriales bacterium]|nr:MAG: Ppx/GppA family phosphatase [Thermodesulfobacteriales bacterium]